MHVFLKFMLKTHVTSNFSPNRGTYRDIKGMEKDRKGYNKAMPLPAERVRLARELLDETSPLVSDGCLNFEALKSGDELIERAWVTRKKGTFSFQKHVPSKLHTTP